MRHRRIIVMSLVLALSPCSYAYLGIDVLGPGDARVNVQLGMGIDLVTGESKQIAVTGDHETIALPTLEYSLHLIETKEDLEKAMRISVGAKGDTLIWAAEGKADFYTNFTRSVDTVALFVSVKATTEIERFKGNPVLDRNVMQAGVSPDDFKRLYGTHYVSAVRKGGELYAVLYIHNITETAQQNLNVHLSARYKTCSGYADFSSEIKEITQTEEKDLEIKAKGGSVSIPGKPKVEDLLSLASDFPATVSQPGKAYPMEVEVANYDAIATPAVSRALYDIGRATSEWERYSNILERLDDIYYNPGDYVDANLAAVERARDEASSNRTIIVDFLDRFPKENIPLPTPTFQFKWPTPQALLFVNGQIAAKESERDSRYQVRDDLCITEPDDPNGWQSRRELASFYEALGSLYEARQFIYACKMDADSLLRDSDAYKAALYLGISFYVNPDQTRGLSTKGFPELQHAKDLEKKLMARMQIEPSPIIAAIVDCNWPYGVDGELVIDRPDGPQTLPAGSVMDFNRIYIGPGCRLSIVADGDPRIHPFTHIVPGPRYTRNPHWHEPFVSFFGTNTTDRYLKEARTFEKDLGENQGVAGAITILGCRTDCRIDGVIDYNGLDHNDVTSTARVICEGRYQPLISPVKQALGGAGGNGGQHASDKRMTARGGDGTDGYGGGGGGGYAGSDTCECTGGNGGSGGRPGGWGKLSCPEPGPEGNQGSIDPRVARLWQPGHSGGGPRGKATTTDHYARRQRLGGDGGMGGTKGTHGGALCIQVRGDFLGAGMIDLGGGSGGNGSPGGNGGYGPNVDEDTGDMYWECNGGGGGGGGAGGSGGNYWLFHGGVVSEDVRVNVQGGRYGQGGAGGTGGAWDLPPSTVDWSTRFCLCNHPACESVYGKPGSPQDPNEMPRNDGTDHTPYRCSW